MTGAPEGLAPQFERRRIAGTTIDVSIMALGSAPLGGLYQPASQQAANETIAAALAAGINLIDVAPQYGQGLAERRVGAGVAALSNPSFVLSTKVGRLLEPAAADVAKPESGRRRCPSRPSMT